jgi:hypothetical protein
MNTDNTRVNVGNNNEKYVFLSECDGKASCIANMNVNSIFFYFFLNVCSFFFSFSMP